MSNGTGIQHDPGSRPEGHAALAALRPPGCSAAELRALFEAAWTAILVIGHDDRVIDFNDRFVAMWRLPPELAAVGDHDAVLDWVERSFADPDAFRLRVARVETHDPPGNDILRLADGRVIWRHSDPQVVDGRTVGRVWSFVDMAGALQPLQGEQPAPEDAMELSAQRLDAQAQLVDESHQRKLLTNLRKSSAERLRNLTRRLMHAEEEERRRLGRELHDRVGSNISALGMGLELLRSELGQDVDGAKGKRLGDLQHIVLETMEHVRSVLADLRPTALDDLGLLPALRHQAAVLTARSGIRFTVAGAEPSPRLPPESEIAFYRVAQESWANAMKHSGASSVALRLFEHEGLVTMTVDDDGVGFEPAALPLGTPSLGLTTMRERAEAIGALLEVAAGPGAGVVVQLSLARRATA